MIEIRRPIKCRDEVLMDRNHIGLIYALVTCTKPLAILELGIGSGAVTSAIIAAIAFNRTPDARVTCVDNFLDWGGVIPHGVTSLPVRLFEKSERDFVESCKDKFDFIVSDADHEHSHEWADKTLRLLNPGGIAVFHDVSNPDYPNLASIIAIAESMCFQMMIFNTSSRSDERCGRGILIVSNL